MFPIPQLVLIDFYAKGKLELGLRQPPLHLARLHSPVIPIALHLSVFSAGWASYDEVGFLGANIAPNLSAVRRICEIIGVSVFVGS